MADQKVKTDYTLEEVSQADSAFGQITRHVLFGHQNRCSEYLKGG